MDRALELLKQYKIEKLLVDDDYKLTGLITIKDIEKTIRLSELGQRQCRTAFSRGGGRCQPRCDGSD